MSALAKPGSTFTAAVNSTTIVPNENIQTAEPLDIPALPNAPGSSAKYFIVFTTWPVGGATKEIKIEFTASAARDTSLTNWLSANTAVVA